MSHRRIVLGFGLLASSFAGQAFAQQKPIQYAYPQGQSQNSGQMGNSQPIYAQQPKVSAVGFGQVPPQGQPQQPVNGQQTFGQVSLGHHPQAAEHAQPMQGGYSNPGCTTYDTASSGNFPEKNSTFWTNYYRNVRWPTPFRAQDVTSVTNYFDIQRENGWRLHNTVGNAMFDPQTNCLTQAGKNHIQSILRDNPANRKVVFVLQAQTQQQTAARIQSTELAISELLPVGDLPPVYVTDRDAPGSSGAYQTAVTRAMMTSVPVPRLNAQGGGAGGGGTSGSSGSSGSSTP